MNEKERNRTGRKVKKGDERKRNLEEDKKSKRVGKEVRGREIGWKECKEENTEKKGMRGMGRKKEEFKEEERLDG